MLAQDKVGVVGYEAEIADGDDRAEDEPVVSATKGQRAEEGARNDSRLEVAQSSKSYPH